VTEQRAVHCLVCSHALCWSGYLQRYIDSAGRADCADSPTDYHRPVLTTAANKPIAPK